MDKAENRDNAITRLNMTDIYTANLQNVQQAYFRTQLQWSSEAKHLEFILVILTSFSTARGALNYFGYACFEQ